MTAATRARGAHLVGSVALGSTGEVFEAVSQTLGQHLRRVPDGEPGLRREWVRSLGPILQRVPELHVTIDTSPEYWVSAEVKEGADATAIDFGPLGYAENAEASYREFLALRGSGGLPEGTRMQVSMPTPAAASILFAPSTWAQVETSWVDTLIDEVARVVAAVPAEDLAIQWDVCVEILMIEGAWLLAEGADEQSLLDQVRHCIDSVPSSVEAGVHLCYGDYEHKHSVESTDTGLMVRFLNALVDDAASAVVGEFGVATECGMGRCSPEEIGQLLKLHAAVAAPLAT